jgi:mono/diheme cytochrome c family protein
MNRAVFVAVALAGVGFAGAALADEAASKAKYESVCSDCHEAADFSGKSVAHIEKKIMAISAGTLKHKKKFTMSEAEAKDLATYLSALK